MKITWSGFMFGDTFHIRYFDNFSNSLIFLERSFMLTFPMAYLAFFVFSTLIWSWDPERLPTPFLISPIYSEDVVSILFGLSNFSEIFKVTHLWLPLISLCFLTLRRPQFFHVYRLKQILLTCEIFLPERLPSGETMINIQLFYNY